MHLGCCFCTLVFNSNRKIISKENTGFLKPLYIFMTIYSSKNRSKYKRIAESTPNGTEKQYL